MLRPDVDLGDASGSLRVELTIGEVGAEHQQRIAIVHRVIAGREADEPCHADIVGVVPFHMLLALERVDHRAFELFAQGEKLIMRAGASRAAQQRDAACAVQEIGERLRLAGCGTTTGSAGRRSRDAGAGASIAGWSATSPGITMTETPRLPTASRIAISSAARHLLRGGDELAIVAALFEQRLGMRFLEIARADLGRGDVGRDGQNRHARAMAVEQTVDEVQIARPAAPGTDGERAGEMRLGAGRESRHLLMPDMHPVDLLLPADRIGDPVQAVADDAVDALDAGRRERLCELICNCSHDFSSFC